VKHRPKLELVLLPHDRVDARFDLRQEKPVASRWESAKVETRIVRRALFADDETLARRLLGI
jgi:hypothetical protein